VRSNPRKKRSTTVRMNGMDDRKPEMSVRKSGAYPNMRFWSTPRRSPATNASGIERSPAATTAASEPSTTSV
jgi:hypothetical protein